MKIEGIEIGADFNSRQRKFKELEDAKIQAIALSLYYTDGRWKVYQRADKTYFVQWDECKVRDGVEDDFIFSSDSNCNSGTWDYRYAKIAAAKEVYGIC